MSEYPSSRTPIFDPEQLAGITGGRVDLGRRILEEYRKSVPAILKTMQEAVVAEDWKAVSFSAHSLKGSSRTIGGKQLGDLCETMERAPSAALLPSIIQGLDELMVIVEDEVKRASP